MEINVLNKTNKVRVISNIKPICEQWACRQNHRKAAATTASENNHYHY